MALEIVTAKSGAKHISSDDIAKYQKASYGSGIVLNTRDLFEAYIPDANTVIIKTGDAIMPDGRYVTSTTQSLISIENGTIGYKRNDLIGIQYNKDDNNVESVSLVVIKGKNVLTAQTPQVPSYDTTTFLPLYIVPIKDVTLGTPIQVFETATFNYENEVAISGAVKNRLSTIQGRTGTYTRITVDNDYFVSTSSDKKVDCFVFGSIYIIAGAVKAKQAISFSSGNTATLVDSLRVDYTRVLTLNEQYWATRLFVRGSSRIAVTLKSVDDKIIVTSAYNDYSGENSLSSGSIFGINSIWSAK